MNQAVVINVRFARQHHRVAVWASGMASRFGAAFYRDLATRSRKHTRDFMRAARRAAA